MRTLLLICLLIGASPAAPLPPVRPFVFRPGTYDLQWCGGGYRATFAEGGSYECEAGTTRWIGAWHVEVGELHVIECLIPSLGDTLPSQLTCRWSVKLPVGPVGKVGGSKVIITLKKLP